MAYQTDVRTVLADEWDLVIAHPPCTHLATAGAKWFDEKRRDGRQQEGINFFMLFTELDCKWAIENPIGIMSSVYRKPDQYIQPYMFGDPFEKRTCLWLNGLPKLCPTNIVTPPPRKKFESGRSMPSWYADVWYQPRSEWSKIRSKTFPGIAKAMAEQWGGI